MTNQIKLAGVRVYIHALRMAIEARDVTFATSAAAHLSKLGRDDAVRKCIHMCMFRLGVALLFPYLVPVVSKYLADREYQGALNIVANAPRTPFVLHFVHMCASKFHTGRVPSDAKQAAMFHRMLALCGEGWRTEAEGMLRVLCAEDNFLKIYGKDMHAIMRNWRADDPNYAYGHWKYVAVTILAFMCIPQTFPCNLANSGLFSVPKCDLTEPSPLPDPASWPAAYHLPARRHAHWFWPWASDRPPRSIRQRLSACGDAAALLDESQMEHSCSSWELAHERFFEHNIETLAAHIQKKITLYNISDNPLMHHFPSRTAFAINVPEFLHDVPPEKANAMISRELQGFEFVTMVQMRSAEEAADIESAVRGADEFFKRERRGDDINLEMLPVHASGRMLFTGYYPLNATEAAPVRFFKMGHLLERKTGLLTYENSFWAERGGLVRWFPYGEHRYAVPQSTPIPAEAHSILNEINVY